MISDSTVTFDDRDQAMRCSACFEATHVSRAVLSDPDRFIEMLELTQMDHAGCKNYRDVRLHIEARPNMQPRQTGNRPDVMKNHLKGSIERGRG